MVDFGHLWSRDLRKLNFWSERIEGFYKKGLLIQVESV